MEESFVVIRVGSDIESGAYSLQQMSNCIYVLLTENMV